MILSRERGTLGLWWDDNIPWDHRYHRWGLGQKLPLGIGGTRGCGVWLCVNQYRNYPKLLLRCVGGRIFCFWYTWLRFESDSAGMFGNGLGGFLCGLVFPFRFHAFFWCVMQWRRRVPWISIGKYWWKLYQIIERWYQYLFYCTNIVWIMYWSNICRTSWNGLIWVGVFQINVNWVRKFMIPIYNWLGVISIYISPNFFNFNYFFPSSAFLKIMLSLKFYTMFSFSFFIVPCHGKNLMTESKILQLISLELLTCEYGIPMALYEFIAIFLSMFCTKSTLILLLIFQLLKVNSWSQCTRLSMKFIAWLYSAMSLFPNRTLTIARYFDRIVTANNKRCYILVRLVSVNWSVDDMDIWLVLSI